MSAQFIGEADAVATVSSTSITTPALSAPAQVGDRIIVFNVLDSTATSVTDNLSTVYTVDLTPIQGPADQVWSGVVAVAGTPTVTVHMPSGTGNLMACIYRGLSMATGAGAAVDVSAIASGTSGSPGPTATTAATSGANELVIGLEKNGGAAGASTAGTGYVLRGDNFSWYRTVWEDNLNSGPAGVAQSANTNSPAGVTGTYQVCIVYKLASDRLYQQPFPRVSGLGVG